MGRKGYTNNPKCVVCGARTKRNGKTSSGTKRFRCYECGASSTISRPDVASKALLKQFVTWLLGTKTITDMGYDRAVWARKTKWCWRVIPPLEITGEIAREIQIDGIYLSRSACLLIALEPKEMKVLAYHLAPRESTQAYQMLLKQLPPPDVVVTDGMCGALKAIKTTWPQSTIQRCLVHVHRNGIADLTHQPKTEPGKELKRLYDALLHVKNPQGAATWLKALNEFRNTWGKWLNERTYRNEIPTENIPSWGQRNKVWWYTHQRGRRAYMRLEKLAKGGTLFTYLAKENIGEINYSTNRLEGGINAQLRAIWRTHRGMKQPHQIIAALWFINQHSHNPTKPEDLYHPHLKTPPKTPQKQTDTTPAKYDNAINENKPYEEIGLHIRKGWAGRP